MKRTILAWTATAVLMSLLGTAAIAVAAEEKSDARPRAVLGAVIGPEAEGPGVLIAAVRPGGPAHKAGLRTGDRIVRINESNVSDASELAQVIADRKPGEAVKLRVVRGEKEITLTATLAEAGEGETARPPRKERPAPRPENKQPREGGEGNRRAALGLMLEGPGEGEDGARVIGVLPQGPGAKAGVKPGDVLVRIDDQKVASAAETQAAVQKRKPGDKVVLVVRREGKEGQEEKKLEATLASAVELQPKPEQGEFPFPPTVKPPVILRPGTLPGELDGKELPRLRQLEQEVERLNREMRELRRQLEQIRRHENKPDDRPPPKAAAKKEKPVEY